MPLEHPVGNALAVGVKADHLVPQTFPARTEGSVKKHWYKDMHYAEFAEDEVRGASAPVTAFPPILRASITDCVNPAERSVDECDQGV